MNLKGPQIQPCNQHSKSPLSKNSIYPLLVPSVCDLSCLYICNPNLQIDLLATLHPTKAYLCIIYSSREKNLTFFEHLLTTQHAEHAVFCEVGIIILICK